MSDDARPVAPGAAAMPASARLPDLEAALRLFDETTAALSARLVRMDEVLMQKQRELVAANGALATKVAELHRVSSYLDLVVGACASGVVAVDRAGRVTTANAAAGDALRVVRDPLIGADFRAAFPDAPLWRLLDGVPAVGGYERTLRLPDGSRRTLAVKASPLRAADGDLLGAVEVFEDVTEVRRLRETVERADRLAQLGEMAAGVAHEIRNPLNGIEGFASLLARDLPEGDPKRRYAKLIVEGVRNLNRTVTGLLEFTKPRRPDRQPHPPRELAEACLELVRAELAVRGEPAPTIELIDRWPGGAVPCDGAQLKQVLLNLVQNAVQAVQEHRPEGGQVRLCIEPAGGEDDDDGIAFSVDDNGPGVLPEARQRIFTPFFTTKDHGTGLGLAVSYSIIDLHGGSLGVEDSPLGGARFRVILPV